MCLDMLIYAIFWIYFATNYAFYSDMVPQMSAHICDQFVANIAFTFRIMTQQVRSVISCKKGFVTTNFALKWS